MALAVRDTADRADQLVAITRRLSELVSQETQAMRAGHIDAASQSWAEKERLAHAYRLEMVRIGKDPALLAGVAPLVKSALTDAVRSFRAVLAEHAHALRAVKDVTEAMVRSVCEEVAASQAPPPTYRANGAGYTPKNRGRGIALDATA